MATITTQELYLNLTPGGVMPVLHVSQGDSGLEALVFKLFKNRQLFNVPGTVTNIQLNGATPVGVFSYDANTDPAVTWSGNTITASITQTMTAEKGITICELRMLDAQLNSIGTLNFVLSVEPSPYTTAHVSTSDMATIVAALNGAQQYELLSKSWAVGDTGVRSGENTNNSEYWSQQSEINGQRWATGEVDGTPVPSTDPAYQNSSKHWAEESDKNGERWSVGQIDGVDVPSTDPTYQNNSKYWSKVSQGWAKGGTATHPNEETDNSEYWSQQSDINGQRWATGEVDGTPVPSTDPAYQNNSKYWSEISHMYANQVSYKKVYANVAEMVADTELIDGQVVRTLGYYAVNDGGGALYRIYSTVPATYYETLSNGLYAELIAEGDVRPEMFGAHGDGSTDDTTAVQNAVNSGHPCFIDKTYGVTNTILLPTHSALYGAGRGDGCIKYVGNSNTNNPVIAIPYTSEFCAVHDITIDGNGKAPGIYDCYNRPEGTLSGIRTQLYNLNLARYTTYGIYLNGMGSEVYNCYITGVFDYSQVGMEVVSTDNRIRDCRLQLNNVYGLRVTGPSNFISGVKCCVNEKGAYISTKAGTVEIECQENRSHGAEVSNTSYCDLIFTLATNSYESAGGYGAIFDNCQKNNITIMGQKHNRIGSGSTGKERAIIYLDHTDYFNNIIASFRSPDYKDLLYIDGISACNHIIANGNIYDNFDILTSQGYASLNRSSNYTALGAATSLSFDAKYQHVDITLAPQSLSGLANLFKLENNDFAQYSELIVVIESDYSCEDTLYERYMKLNFPTLTDSNDNTIQPSETYNISNYRYIIAKFNIASSTLGYIRFRTSSSNDCDNAKNGMKFQVFAKI